MSCEGEWELMQKRCENSAAPPQGGQDGVRRQRWGIKKRWR